MKNRIWIAGFFGVSLFAGTARAEIIVDHQPLRTGGLGSDTLFLDDFGRTVWQRIADDFTLVQPVTLARVIWWGFYNHDVTPASESMQVRFYGTRLSDGLPDESNLLYAQSTANPTRTWTGRTILDGGSPKEYLYQIDLNTPLSLDAGVPYWLEIVQLGDLSTHFRWEFSIADLDDSASINSVYTDWHYVGQSTDAAFQLFNIPEPSSILLVAAVVFLVVVRRWR